MNHIRTFMAIGIVLLLAGVLSAQTAPEKSVEEQYKSLAQSRTKAELAVRGAREFFGKNEAATRTAIAAADRAKGKAAEVFRKAIEIEQRKPEDKRNLTAMDEATQHIQQLQNDWEEKSAKEVAAISAKYQEAGQLSGVSGQVYQGLVNVEAPWKDAKIDLAPLQASFEGVAKRAADELARGKEAIAEAKEIQKTWEGRMEQAMKATAKK